MSTKPLLTVRKLSKTYARRLWWGGMGPRVAALDRVSFTLDAGSTLAVVGPSGSGKSTLARCLAGLDSPTEGEVVFNGDRLEIQLIPQQPAASLNPRFTAAAIIEEPLVIQRRGTPASRRQKVASALELVGLAPDEMDKRSDRFSGGEKQRLAIARALMVEPKLFILDESLTGLDAGLQAQIAALLKELQSRLGVAFILISHDLDLAAAMADEIAVMERGRIVEQAPAGQLAAAPRHPLTVQLLTAAKALSV